MSEPLTRLDVQQLDCMDLNEAALFLKCHRDKLLRMAQSGDVPCTGRGRIFRFTRDELVDWIRSGYHPRWQFLRKKKQPREDGPGVYFLCACEEILYVGQSTNIVRRLKQHRYAGVIPFEIVHFVTCRQERLDELEAHYIDLYRPPYNVQRGRTC